MILNLAYTNRNLYIFNQVRFKLIYSLLGLSIIDLYIKDFYYLVNTLINKANVCIKKKFFLYFASFLSLALLKCLKMVYLMI